MAYVPDPTDPSRPTSGDLAGNMALEFQSLKGYIQSIISSGNNIQNASGFRNRLNNGGMTVAQRGTAGAALLVPTNSSIYTLDQWIVSSNTNTTQVSQANGVTGANQVSILLSPTNLSVTQIQLSQRIESLDCHDFTSGAIVTVSGTYIPSAGDLSPPQVALFTTASSAAVDDWSSTRLACPAQAMNTQAIIAGQVSPFTNTFILIQDSTAGLMLSFAHNISTALLPTYGYTNIKLEKSLFHTPFAFRSPADELEICQRYYFDQVSVINPSDAAGAGDAGGDTIYFPVTMRKQPTITATVVSSSNITSAAIGLHTANSVNMTTVSTGVGQVTGLVHIIASAEL